MPHDVDSCRLLHAAWSRPALLRRASCTRSWSGLVGPVCLPKWHSAGGYIAALQEVLSCGCGLYVGDVADEFAPKALPIPA
jgi:hypothetical protein